MKAKELTIGNWVKRNLPTDMTYAKVLEIIHNGLLVQDKDGYVGCSMNFIEPIELTEEVLLKIGFKKNKYDWWKYFPDRENEISILMTENYTTIEYANLFHCPEDVTEVNYGSTLEFPRRIYLHQLQNAYYLLTGQEMEIEL